MSYKVNRDDEHIVIPDGPVTAREVRKLMKQSSEKQNESDFIIMDLIYTIISNNFLSD